MRISASGSIGPVLLATCLLAGCSDDRAAAEIVAHPLQATLTSPLQASPGSPPGSETLAEKGERMASILGCRGCHGADLHGQPWEDDPQFAILFSSNLTRALPRYTDVQLEHAIREGVRYDGSPLWEMPASAFVHLSASDMQALIAYLRSVPQGGEDHPRLVLGPEGEKEVKSGAFAPAADAVAKTRHLRPVFAGAENVQGQYLAQIACGECHGPDLRGNPDPEMFRPDLVVAVAYPLADFRTLIKTGKPRDDRDLGLMAQVARSRFSHLTEAEVEAIHGYLVARVAMPQ